MGKNILIVGASGEIGQAVAIQLAKEGHHLVLHYNTNRVGIEQIIKQVEDASILSVIQSDLTMEASAKNVLSALAFSMDAVIFASGQAYTSLFQDTPETIMDRMLKLHVKAPWLITQGLLPGMIQKNAGHVLFVTSIWAEVGASMEVVYSSVKGAQRSFVKALSKEVSSSGVIVKNISPGYIDTAMNRHLSEDEKHVLFNDIPLRKGGTAEDVAKTAAFLLTDTASRTLLDDTIHVTGGWDP
ncbi:3-oxoacyl-[acyl-carrier-protein] reductase [Lentibacillus sp. JNUCC-1]|uniref:elongation factor P 5-aminopentanone reductase n=1 Tax=Lentibacillus sp. JNUCC-1 TaxID=2654513 RepID=UPI0012E81739|nr:SDR family NAD(P)-dependent oxidoreductase [Lentibacillus sp. JNUCC-1]MUV39897.1 3-oxoacyl-[acyl-carrier-protein] reductase [Lentibacillus sp. JNUCC-1]